MHIWSGTRPPLAVSGSTRLVSRQEPRTGVPGGVIAAATVGAIVLVLVVSWLVLRKLRAHYPNPRFVPGAYFKAKWRAWSPKSIRGRAHSSLFSRVETQESSQSASRSTRSRIDGSAGLTQQERVDRHTSVRSIASLPAYSSVPRPEEEIIAREGERGGIDTVIEFPETVEEEEARREDEMESLYQIRRARRAERTARQDRRDQRRQARERGDMLALEEIRRQRQEATAAAANASAADMLRDHQAKERGRRVSSVSYADLGVARHDGSRVRADSNDSDHRPLLDSAAGPGTRSRAGSSALSMHLRNQSSLSVATRVFTPDVSDDEDGNTGSGDAESRSLNTTRPSTSTDAQPRRLVPEAAAGDVGGAAMPPPPEYDGQGWPAREEDEDTAPPYESPVDTQAPRLAPMASLPSIHIDPSSPIAAEHENSTPGEPRRLP